MTTPCFLAAAAKASLVGPGIGAALWPVISWLLLLPQRRLDREQMI